MDFVFLNINGCIVPFRADDPRLRDKAFRSCPRVANLDGEAEQDENGWTRFIGWKIGTETIVSIDTTTANSLALLSDGKMVPLHPDLITHIDYENKTLTLSINPIS